MHENDWSPLNDRLNSFSCGDRSTLMRSVFSEGYDVINALAEFDNSHSRSLISVALNDSNPQNRSKAEAMLAELERPNEF